MKKVYIEPQLEIIQLKVNNTILAGSEVFSVKETEYSTENQQDGDGLF